MIDWFRGEIDFLHVPIPAGRVISIEADGEISWEAVKRIECRSTWETNLMIRSGGSAGNGMASTLLIDGNLCKFLQGHNILGSRNLNQLLYLAFKKIYALHHDHLQGCSSPDITEAKILRGDYRVKMLDINQLYDVGNDASVEAWLHAAHMRARSRSGRAVRDQGTVYLAKSSRRWAFKFYNKAREVQAGRASKKNGHHLPEALTGLGFEEFIQGKLRAELRIMSKELEKLNLTHGHHFTPQVLQNLFNSYLGKIDMSQQVTLIDEALEKLPRGLYGTYQLWRQGSDVKHLLPHRTFYRHRKLLLEHGIDIACVLPDNRASNVVPMIRIIEAVPVENPSWAYERGLIAA